MLTHIFITWWRHQMEIFSALLTLCEGIHWSPVDSPHKGQWLGALMFSLICTWTNSWAINPDAGDLRRQHNHYDVTVMNSVGHHTGSSNDLSLNLTVQYHSIAEQILTFCQVEHSEQTSLKFKSKYKTFTSRICIWKCHPWTLPFDKMARNDTIIRLYKMLNFILRDKWFCLSRMTCFSIYQQPRNHTRMYRTRSM